MSPDPILLALIYTVLLSVSKAQHIRVLPKVWGYVGQEVILPCQLVQGKDPVNITQVQWKFQTSEDLYQILVVSNVEYGISIQDEKYKDKLSMEEHSLVIKSVDAADAGSYSCNLATFPAGSFTASTTLVVRDQMPLSVEVVVVIGLTVTLLLGITTAAVCVIVLRRCSSFPGNNVSNDTQSEMKDLSTPSIIKREDVSTVVYSEVELRTSNRKCVKVGDEQVTYSEVNVRRKKTDDGMYAQIMHL